jgi:hypothetical protein
MTASKPAHVRLAILIDAEDERLCDIECHFYYCSGHCSAFGKLSDINAASNTVYRDARHSSCLSATKAFERDEAIVAAAESFHAFAHLSPRPGEYAIRRARLTKAVDAKRADEAKEPKSNE